MRKRLPISPTSTTHRMVRTSRTGKAAAFIYDQMSTYSNWQKNRDTTRALLKPFQEEAWAIGVRKGNDQLLGRVNAFLQQFHGGVQYSSTCVPIPSHSIMIP